jgi:hypothetical protein
MITDAYEPKRHPHAIEKGRMTRRILTAAAALTLFVFSLVVFALPPTSAAAPSNDDFNNAIEITSLPFSQTIDPSEATAALDDPYGCSNNYRTVWFRLTPASAARIVLTTTDYPYATAMSAWTGSRGSLAQAACSQMTYPPSSYASFNAVPGQTYYIMLSGTYYYPEPNSFNLTVSVGDSVANDDVIHAATVSALPFSADLDTRFAVSEGFDYCGPSAASVWYSFTPNEDVRLQIDTTSSTYWAVPYVFTGTPNSLSAVLCGRSQNLRTDLSAGQTYYIEIASWSSGGGNLALRLSVAPPPLAIVSSLSTSGSVNPPTGIATVAGAVSCNQPSYVFGNGTVQQKIGNGIVNGYFSISGFCDAATPLAWNATVNSQPSDPIGRGRAATLFTGGRASATVNAQAFSPATGEFASAVASGMVTLKGSR